MTELSQLFEIGSFSNKEYIAVAAIAIRFTDPLKFNSYIILLAHYVICIWFLKCKGDIRRAYADFARNVTFFFPSNLILKKQQKIGITICHYLLLMNKKQQLQDLAKLHQ